MPNSYNTSSPTQGIKNTINSITTEFGLRDFLLNLNLSPRYSNISTSINGSPKVGEPVIDLSVNDNINNTPNFSPIETNGVDFKDNLTQLNTFVNNESNNNVLSSINHNLTIPNNNYSNSTWSQGIFTYPIGSNDDISTYGLMGKTLEANYFNKNINNNLYLDRDSQIDSADLINFKELQEPQIQKGYLDTYGDLNLGGSGPKQAVDVIGSVINGQGLGIGNNGLINNFDIRTTLAGRVLGATGVIKDTKLGIIGGKQLLLAFANNAGYNVQQELLGSLNAQDNILSLVKGNGLVGFRPSYKITIPKSTGGRILDTTTKILGFTLPKSYLGEEGSIFQSENGDVGNIERANSMILNTGKGQIDTLLSNMNANLQGTTPNGIDNPNNSLFRTGYSPAFKNNKDELQITNAIVYSFGKDGANINLLSMDGAIPSINYEREEQLSNDGFRTPEEDGFGPRGNYGYENRKISDVGFTWTSNNNDKLVNSVEEYDILTGNKKSLLVKTQLLFNSKGMKNIVTSKGEMNKRASQIQTTNGGGISKGNAVLSSKMFDSVTGKYKGDNIATAGETFCRSWTTLDRYDSVSKLVRSGVDGIEDNGESGGEFEGVGINENVPFRFKTQGSVLDSYGHPKIGPYRTDKSSDPKKFMFSIENLAWAGDSFTLLPESERGPGDLLTGKRGRIMWFPPYDIQFSENSNVNWETNNFIGRGESLYTYNNTERAGNLSFKVVVDHPSYVNSFRGSDGPDDSYINSFWAGCIDPNSKMGERLTISERSQAVEIDQIKQTINSVINELPPSDLSVYFPNDNTVIEPLYESGMKKNGSGPINYSTNPNGQGEGLGYYEANYTPGNHNNANPADGEGWPDRYNYGLNYSTEGSPNTRVSYVGADFKVLNGFYDTNTDQYMINHLIEVCPNCVATITGYASKQGYLKYNLKLAKDRALVLKNYIKLNWWPQIKSANPKLTDSDFDRRFIIGETEQINNSGCKSCDGIPRSERDVKCPNDTLACKIDRRATISFKFDEKLVGEEVVVPVLSNSNKNRRVTNKIKDKFYNESRYFEKLTDKDKFVFDSFREKIRYFHPGFHSTTPEGLNSRLTFLLQCTRQGETMENQGATNLAFGRAPVCILRIGDFYNTKIIIDNISIDYEPLVWDINPEGIGVQPMIANVSMSFKFIGGSSLMGPINKLQNALSFNYFANSQVYDPRADYISSSTSNDGSDNWTFMSGEKDLSNGETVIESNFETTEEIQTETSNAQMVQYNTTVNNEPIIENNGEPKLTTFSKIEMLHGNNGYELNVGMNTINFTGLSNEECKKFIKKGLIIKLLKGNEIKLNKVIDTVLLFKTFIENEINFSERDGYLAGLTDGKDYILECWYNGSKVCSSNVNVSIVEPFFRLNNKIN